MIQGDYRVVAAQLTSIVAITVSDDSVPEVRSWLRGEEYTPAHGAGVVVVKPGGDAVGADEVTARKADQALYDTGFGRQRAHFLVALAHA